MRVHLLASASVFILTVAASNFAVSAPANTPSPYSGAIDRSTLPIAPPPYEGTLGPTIQTSSPPAFPPRVRPPAGAPNVLVILIDDAGFGASSCFGGPVPTPTLDALASRGLRYNEFHTTALCSPTRAALLTGRNHHSVGFGVVTELATGYPGYDGILSKNAATFGRVLRDNGYATAWFGKDHNTPPSEVTPIGPFDQWPNALGFDEFYGFIGGETNQWAPELFENHTSVEPPGNDPSYLLDRDLADHAVDWLHRKTATSPDTPFVMYYAPGTSHAPLDAPKAWIEKFKGQFDQGWDRLREETFARQKARGVIPATADLTPRPPEIPAWDSLTPTQKKIASHMMEVYAAALAYSDDQIGRIIQALKDSGQYDNTLILYIEGDNGASGEGGLMGTTDAQNVQNGADQDEKTLLANYDAMGGPFTETHYPVGWAWAADTPFQWMKQIASHFGGTRNGLVVSWPAKIQAHGEVRSQFTSIIDVAPTLYEVIGIPAPKTVDGVTQKPIEGTSFAYTFDHPNAPTRHTLQYFEMLGNRAIYKDGWIASTHPERLPWRRGGAVPPGDYRWELYDLTQDYSQAHDLAQKEPAKLAEMKQVFDGEARKYNVYPIDTRGAGRLFAQRARNDQQITHYTYYPSPLRYERAAWPNIVDRSWTAAAQLVAPAGDSDGMIFTQGGRFGGYALYVLNGAPTFAYRLSNAPGELVKVTAPPLAPGPHTVRVAFNYTGGLGGPAIVQLLVDDRLTGEAKIPKTFRLSVSNEGAAVGHDTGTPIVEDYRLPFAYRGHILRVDFDLKTIPHASAPTAATLVQSALADE